MRWRGNLCQRILFFISMYINRFRIYLKVSSILLLNVHLEMWYANRFHSTFAGDLLLCKN